MKTSSIKSFLQIFVASWQAYEMREEFLRVFVPS